MRIMLSNGQFIGTDRFVSGVLRFDCVPIPVSLEFQVVLTPEMDEQLIFQIIELTTELPPP